MTHRQAWVREAVASEPVPLLDLEPELVEHGDELRAAFASVLASRQFILGPQVEAFEGEVARYVGADYAVGVNSGTDALVLGLRALGVGPGAEVVTTPFTFFATAEAISVAGAVPVFVDIEIDTLNIDPDRAAEAVTSRTRALLPVHLFGHAAQMGPVLDLARHHGLCVVEDVAQAFGGSWRSRKLGAVGSLGTFSFFPSKNLGGFGDAGMVVTDHLDVATEVRRLRAHGALDKYHNETIGYNSRLDELQAALLRVKLRHVDRANAGRIRVANRYSELLDGVEDVVTPTVRTDVVHVFHQYTVRIRGGRRDAVASALRELGIATGLYYPTPLHKLPVYAQGRTRLPIAEQASAEVLSLPIWPSMSDEVIERVVAGLRNALGA
jgi:dTDP-4-amino-4,6-dideoxygalactose transaminase